ncbi:MAG TPA: hypothetical protein VK680_06270 [Solirubrobacteraceae bacterium]|jgi:hypothetical protein|nr:hypothetical protein [Solirubrobacteraceae bacterium]
MPIEPRPIVGLPLPRVADAYVTVEKLQQWILADRGHGQEWGAVFRVASTDAELVWRAIVDVVRQALIHKIIDLGRDGIVCGVDLTLTIGLRTAGVRTSWHYAHTGAAPRLVTVYPRL